MQIKERQAPQTWMSGIWMREIWARTGRICRVLALGFLMIGFGGPALAQLDFEDNRFGTNGNDFGLNGNGLGLGNEQEDPSEAARSPRGYDFRTERLRKEVRDCEGYECVRLRNRLISRLRERIEECGPRQCPELRQELRVERRQRNCERAGTECPDPRLDRY